MKDKEQKPLPEWLNSRLPRYEKLEPIPQAFSDSTHQLWRLHASTLDEDNKNYFLKVCSNTDTPFWQIMLQLFDFKLREEISYFSNTYDLIDNLISLKVPKLIQAETLENNNAFILTAELKGSSVTSEDVVSSGLMVEQLAKHLSELHSQPKSTWGNVNNPKFESRDWASNLEATLIKSAKKWGGVFLDSDKHLKQALAQYEAIRVSKFVPMMPDLRWDQFLQKEGELSALVDLDAFVIAPIELDFVILEYLLSADQISIFKEAYSKQHAIPDLNQVRSIYRLLLFYLQILGETDLNVWMDKETLF